MRLYLYISICLIGSIFSKISAQNYRTIPLNVKEQYYKDSLGYVFPIEPDSMKFMNGDTVYYHFKSIRTANTIIGGNFNLKGDSWAGRKTIIKANGDNIWFASKGDSILIKPLLTINGSWLVSKKHDLYGTVSGIALKTYCGIIDTVKTLKIGKYSFELSKNYGLINMPDIYNFYATSTGVDYPFSGPKSNVELYGSNLIRGTKTKLTDSLVYNFEVGDEFHYAIYDLEAPYQTWTSSIVKILTKTISGMKDSVTYNSKYCENSKYAIPVSDPDNMYHYTYRYEVATFSGERLISRLFRNSGETPLKSNISSNNYNSTKGDLLYFDRNGWMEQLNNKDQYYCEGYYQENDSVFLPTACVLRVSSENDEPILLEGRGSLRGYYYNASAFTEELVYYDGKLGTLGSKPFICDSLIARYATSTTDHVKLLISPISPFNEKLIIHSNKPIKNTKLIDLLGTAKVDETTTYPENGQYSINTQGISAGMYLLLVTDWDGKSYSFKVLKQ